MPGLHQSVFTLMASSPLQVVALNKRSKEAESAFLGIYKQLIEAPGESPTKTRDVHLHKQQQQQTPHSHTLLLENSPSNLYHYRWCVSIHTETYHVYVKQHVQTKK